MGFQDHAFWVASPERDTKPAGQNLKKNLEQDGEEYCDLSSSGSFAQANQGAFQIFNGFWGVPFFVVRRAYLDIQSSLGHGCFCYWLDTFVRTNRTIVFAQCGVQVPEMLLNLEVDFRRSFIDPFQCLPEVGDSFSACTLYLGCLTGLHGIVQSL